jgi:acyl-CoA dehydrogenase
MLWFLVLAGVVGALAYFRVRLLFNTLIVGAALAVATAVYGVTVGLAAGWVLFAAFAIIFNLAPLRRRLISAPVMEALRQALPSISQTEREALEAGSVWWDAELFSGKPNWQRLRETPASTLSDEEQAFLDGPVETLCGMLDDWKITHEDYDLSPEIWAFLKQHRFFGMIIPKQYGGLEFSARGHSEVVMKIASRSITAAVTVMVPNSLGPAKLLLEYGTETQKDHYLPRLATGEEIPCFALTGPEAGSDAGAIPDTGVVCRGEFDGEKDVLGIRLNWEKRYITLGPVATVLGLAFKLQDPDHLLGEETDRGITLALIPTDLPGISIGNRHYPLNIPFQNGPNRGEDVFIPLHMIIGGPEYAGQGWRMLMECLAEGRGISLPALSTGAGKVMSRVTGAYARVRRQFKMPIGKFEGIEEPLARIAGETYIMDAARRLTAAAIDQGEQPSVVSAIIKYQLTERMRKVVNDAMDIQGGSGICLGPRNFIGRVYEAIPISITVEGANILTRSMIIFGQGAIRCHPHLLAEINAAQNPDSETALADFDHAFTRHLGYSLSNLVRAFWLGATNARLSFPPGEKETRIYYRQLTRLSAAFALVSDVALVTLGGRLKRKERLSGRFADVLSNMYLCSAVLKHWEDQGHQHADLPLVHYACHQTIYRAQQSLLAVFWNLPFRPLAHVLRALVFPGRKPYRPPNDETIHQVAALLLEPSPTRDRLTEGVYVSDEPGDVTGRIEYALETMAAAAPVEEKLRHAAREGRIHVNGQMPDLDAAMQAGIIDTDEAERLRLAWQASLEAIQVDEFAPGELRQLH